MDVQGNTNFEVTGRWCLARAGRLLLILSLLLSSACAAGRNWQYLPATKADERSVYVVGHGWHTGIVLSKEELGNQLSFVTDYLGDGRYYEFGWGEAEWYQAEKVTPGVFLKTVFWRNPSVMHVVSMPVLPQKYFRGSEVVELDLSQKGLEHLKDHLRKSFAFQGGAPYPLKVGPGGESRFFEAIGDYTIFDTCNTWTAKVLASGGVPMDTVFTLRAAGVMRQVKAAKEGYRTLRPWGEPAPAPIEGNQNLYFR